MMAKATLTRIGNALRTFFSNPVCVFCLGMAVTLLATALEVIRCRNTNYYDYYDSTMLFWSGISPYTLEYAETHNIYFLYTPVFSTVFAPIFMLPSWLGPFVWNIMNYSLFALAIKTLPEPLKPYRLKIFLFLLPVLLQSIFCYQYNTVVCYIFLFAFTLLERGKALWAVLLIAFSMVTKVYGGIELALLLCYPKLWRNAAMAIVFAVALFLLPAINPGFDNVLDLYRQQFEMIAAHHSDSDFVGLLFARGLKPLLLPNYRAVQLVVLLMLAVIFFLRYRRWCEFRFRVQALAAMMGYVILFSDSPETHTYIVALSGYAMAFWMQPRRTWLDWTLFWLLFVNFGILPTDVLCPAWLHEYIHETFWLDVYCMTIAWLRIVWWAAKPEPNEAPTSENSNYGNSISANNKSANTKSANTKSVNTILLLALAVSLPTQAQPPRDLTFRIGDVQFTMKAVQGGTYLMGDRSRSAVSPSINTSDRSRSTVSPSTSASSTCNQGDADELPLHRVQVADFYLGETEVTQALWKAVMGRNPSKWHGNDQWPVECVSFEDCQEFVTRLTTLTGRQFRLPTEEEWEYAARGGRRSKGYLYSGSNDPTQVAWLQADSLNSKSIHNAVKTKQPNELGLYDMSGSVWEWCDSRYEEYVSPRRNLITCWVRDRLRIIRGGCYNSTPHHARVSNRYMTTVWRRERTVGLRLALSGAASLLP